MENKDETQLLTSQEYPYAAQWFERKAIIDQLEERLQEAKENSFPEDVALAQAVVDLLRFGSKRDRHICLLSDLGKLPNSQPQDFSGEVTALQIIYELTPEEMEEALATRGEYGPGPYQSNSYTHPDDHSLNDRFSLLADLKIKDGPQQTSVEARPVSSGGVDSVAYPVREFSMVIKEGSPIQVALEKDTFSRAGLQRLAGKTDTDLKFGLAKIIQAFLADPDGFSQKRKQDGCLPDPTQL